MNEYRLSMLDREEAELLPTRETLDGFTINNIIGINVAIAIAGFADDVHAAAGQVIGVDN